MKPRDVPTAEMSPELAGLQAVAEAQDQALDAATALPGQEPPQDAPPAIDPVDELAAMLGLAVNILGTALPPVPQHYNDQVRRTIASEYLACAEKYGWTWHTNMGGPELRLAVAIALPGIACAAECRVFLARQREAKAAAQAAAAGQQLEPTAAPS